MERPSVSRATENFKLGVVAATGAICLVYLVSIVLNLFGAGIPYIHGRKKRCQEPFLDICGGLC